MVVNNGINVYSFEKLINIQTVVQIINFLVFVIPMMFWLIHSLAFYAGYNI